MPRVRQLAAGELHTLALTEGGEVWTWGDNQMRQCARSLEEPLLPTPGRVPLPLHAGEVATAVSASGYHSAIVTSHGRVLTLGRGVAFAALADDEYTLDDDDDDSLPPDERDDDHGAEGPIDYEEALYEDFADEF